MAFLTVFFQSQIFKKTHASSKALLDNSIFLFYCHWCVEFATWLPLPADRRMMHGKLTPLLPTSWAFCNDLVMIVEWRLPKAIVHWEHEFKISDENSITKFCT